MRTSRSTVEDRAVGGFGSVAASGLVRSTAKFLLAIGTLSLVFGWVLRSLSSQSASNDSLAGLGGPLLLAGAALLLLGGLGMAVAATEKPSQPPNQPIPVAMPDSSRTHQAPVAPPGWHPDPSGRHEQRYWDGQRWTDAVVTAGSASTDPI